MEAFDELDDSQSEADSDDPQLEVVVPKRGAAPASGRKRGRQPKANTPSNKKRAPEGGSALHCICRTPYDDTKWVCSSIELGRQSP